MISPTHATEPGPPRTGVFGRAGDVAAAYLQAVAAATAQALRADRASCYVFTDDGRVAAIYATEVDADLEVFYDGLIGLPIADMPIFHQVVANGSRLTVVRDIADSDPARRRAAERVGVGAYLAAALWDPIAGPSAGPRGALVASYRRGPRGFASGELDAAQSIVLLAATALASIGATEAIVAESQVHRDAAAEQSALRRLAERVAAGAPSDEIFATAAREVAEMLGCEAGSVLRFRPGGVASVVAAWAAPARRAPQRTTSLLLAGHPALSAIGGGGPGPSEPLPGAALIRVDDRPWGALVVEAGTPERLPADAHARMAPFCDLLGVALANAQARRRLRRQAESDSLTGLANQRRFQHELATQVDLALRGNRELAVVMLDIDNFKLVNDRHGHAAGDRVLRAVAAALSGIARREELLARCGGEEFGWLLPDSDRFDAHRAAERARQAIQDLAVPGVGPITISAGVCELAQAGDAEELFALADRALYLAKERGRNAVATYSPELAERPADDVTRARRESLLALIPAVDLPATAGPSHSQRVADVAAAIAAELGWPTAQLGRLAEAARLHDIGKICLPVAERRPSPLGATPSELGRAHPEMGAAIAADALAADQIAWIRGHHERWDGSGTPDGLIGANIPEGARLIAVADAWDNLVGARAGPPRSAGEALALCRRGIGTLFWPRAVEGLARMLGRGAGGAADLEPPSA